MTENYYENQIDKASIKAISKRKFAMILLKFLTENDEEAYYNAEISKTLNLCGVTAKQNLDRLVASGLVRKVTNNPVDKRLVCYEVINKSLAEKVVEKWKRHIGYELSRFVPVRRTPAEYIKQDGEFVKVCRRYRISLDEGIECLKKSPVVKCESYHGEWIFSRKEAYKEKEKI